MINTEVIVHNMVLSFFVHILPIQALHTMRVANRCIALHYIKSCGGNSLKCCVKYL